MTIQNGRRLTVHPPPIPMRLGRARAEFLLELSLDMLCIANAESYFTRLSPAFTRTLGWSLEELMYRPFLDFVHPDDWANTLQEVERQIGRGEPVLEFSEPLSAQRRLLAIAVVEVLPAPGWQALCHRARRHRP